MVGFCNARLASLEEVQVVDLPKVDARKSGMGFVQYAAQEPAYLKADSAEVVFGCDPVFLRCQNCIRVRGLAA
jgi:hypothetical protein